MFWNILILEVMMNLNSTTKMSKKTHNLLYYSTLPCDFVVQVTMSITVKMSITMMISKKFYCVKHFTKIFIVYQFRQVTLISQEALHHQFLYQWSNTITSTNAKSNISTCDRVWANYITIII